MIRICFIALMIAILPAAHAADGKFLISPRVGQGELRIGQAFTSTDEREEVDTFSVGGTFAFVTPFGLMLEVGADSSSSIDWWSATDEFSLSQRYVALGWEIPFASGWSVTPKAGRARWKLHSEEGIFLNPGAEEERDVRGYEYIWEVQLSRQINDRIAFGGAYQEGEFDFGRARSLTFVATFAF